MTSISDCYRNIVLTVIAALLAFIAFGRSGTTVQAQTNAQMTRISAKDGAFYAPGGQVKAMWCVTPSECYIVAQ